MIRQKVHVVVQLSDIALSGHNSNFQRECTAQHVLNAAGVAKKSFFFFRNKLFLAKELTLK